MSAVRFTAREIGDVYMVPPWLISSEHNTWRDKLWWYRTHPRRLWRNRRSIYRDWRYRRSVSL